ncbi:MAG: dihydrolipoyllysine-residue acetyltransferase [Pseudomonadales bacterium]
MTETVIKVPDIGGAENVEVIEVNVSEGDRVETEQTLIVLESDKASMEVPAPAAGVVKSVSVATGDRVSEGSAIVTLDVADSVDSEAAPEQPEPEPEATVQENQGGQEAIEDTAPVNKAETVTSTQKVSVPDLGGASEVEVIEVSVSVGDRVAQDDTLVVLESDKASMEVPCPFAGEIKSLSLKVGDKVNEGSEIAVLEVVSQESAEEETETPEAVKTAPSPQEAARRSESQPSASVASQTSGEVYAGPAVRLMARELGVDLSQVTATGPRGRILKEDVQAYVKKALAQGSGAAGAGIPPVPDIDFAAFGEIEAQPLSRIQKLTAAAMQRSWLNVPHVAHFDEADITDLEEFRAQNKEKAKARELKLTFLPFLLKACAVALREHPQFNVSLSADGDTLIHKKYCHIGIAMDTPAGLMVPVIRDVDKKGIWELAEEMTALGEKGKTGKLSKADLTGGCFTISSLGAIGGTAFTPIVNLPEVAILGVSKTQVKPVFIEDAFVPRKMLPITLSYDHRAVNGVDAGQFMTCLTRLLADIRRLVM